VEGNETLNEPRTVAQARSRGKHVRPRVSNRPISPEARPMTLNVKSRSPWM